MKGVCGAGKTEIIYGVIEYALNLGQRVCLTMPRKELVVELSKELKNNFSIFLLFWSMVTTMNKLMDNLLYVQHTNYIAIQNVLIC